MHTRHYFPLSLAFILAGMQSSAAAAPIPSVGFGSPEFGHVTKLIEDHMEDIEAGAANLQIRAVNGEVLYNRAFGWLNEEETVPNRLDTMMRVASISKKFTQHAIDLLIKDGKFTKESQVFCLPEDEPDQENCLLQTTPRGLDGVGDPNVRKIKLKHLLDHTAGWNHQIDNNLVGEPLESSLQIAKALGVSSPPSYEAFIDYAVDKGLNAEPGSEVEYSNFGYVILGHIIEVHSGQDFMSFIHARITSPIGIANSEIELGHELVKDRNPREPNYIADFPDFTLPSFFDSYEPEVRWPDGRILIARAAGAGGVISTTDALLDYAREYWFDDFTNRPTHPENLTFVSHGGGEGTMASVQQNAEVGGLSLHADWALLLNRRRPSYEPQEDTILVQTELAIHNTLQKDRTVYRVKGSEDFSSRMGLYIPYDAINLNIEFRQPYGDSCKGEKVWQGDETYSVGEQRRHGGRFYQAVRASKGKAPGDINHADDPFWLELYHCGADYKVLALHEGVPNDAAFDCASTGGGNHNCFIANAPAGMYHITLTALDTEFHHVEAKPTFDWARPCEPYAHWSTGRSYETGDTVRHQGHLYRANYWSYNSPPHLNAGPWESWIQIDTCIETTPE